MEQSYIDDPARAWALCRYQVISAYLAMQPKRGERRKFLEELAARSWTGPDGEPFQVAAETIRVWIRRYRRRGLRGLENKRRQGRGDVKAMSDELVELACALKREVPERSLDRIIRIMEQTGLCEAGSVTRSTLHRVLQKHGISAHRSRIPDRKDLDRFEAEFTNELWQSDMLVGPWLPDPARPDKMRRAYLYAFLDDHSRKLLHGRFSFKGDLPALELVFRRALQRFGLCSRVYYDNGQVYRSAHMRQIVATLGIHRMIFTQPYRPQGHGKIEALNRLIRNAFLSEVKASSIETLDELNEAFLAWADLEYNHKVHSEIGQTPDERWRAGIEHVRYADERLLTEAFTWRDRRTPDKTGVFSLFGVRYQVVAELAKRRIEVHYDPEELEEVEVFHKGDFVQRAKPLEVKRHRRPKARAKNIDQPDGCATEPTVDWLGHLVEQRSQSFVGPTPKEQSLARRRAREKADEAATTVLLDELDEAVVDHAAIAAFLNQYGPFAAEDVLQAISTITSNGRRDHHLQVYFDAIRANCKGGLL